MNRTLVWQLATRYLRGKRSGNIVPILSRISMVAIAVASCAMIVLFSVFNGFVFLIEDLYKAFYPDIKITAAKGKFFEFSDEQMNALKTVSSITGITRSIEDNVLLTGDNQQKVATLKGIDRQFFNVNDVKPFIVSGNSELAEYPMPTAIVGQRVLDEMGMDVNNVFSILTIYYPNTTSSNLSLAPQNAFSSLKLKPDGAFRIQDDFDSKYILAPLHLVQSLLQADGKYASIELKLKPGANADNVRNDIQQVLGDRFTVATRFEQNRTLYMVMRSEKWGVFAILLLVMLIASFNMIGALSLLVLEKQKDMAILRAMGATPGTIRNIFLSEGILWSTLGGSIGLVLGVLICLGQQQFGWISLQGAYIIDAYPVDMEPWDFFIVLASVILVGTLAAWYPAHKARKAQVQLRTG